MHDPRADRIHRAGLMSIVENRKAYHDYFIEEKFEAGVALDGWEVKAIRAGRAQIKEAYVVVKDGEIVLIGAHITPLVSASTHVRRRPDAHAQAAAAPPGDQPSRRPGRARGLHAGAAQPALQQGPDQARSRARQGQEAVRQARDDQGARVEPRAAAAAAPSAMSARCGGRDAAAVAASSVAGKLGIGVVAGEVDAAADASARRAREPRRARVGRAPFGDDARQGDRRKIRAPAGAAAPRPAPRASPGRAHRAARRR